MSNVFSFVGTVGRDAEVKQTNGGSVLNVIVANNIGFGERQQTLWVQVALFGKRAEGKLVDYLKKGQSAFFTGELSQREYQANDGTTKTQLTLMANTIELVGKRTEQSQPPQTSNAPAKTESRKDNFADFNDDIPF